MIKVENIVVYNIARAIYAARNPMNSWAMSDSDIERDILGENDLNLARKLYRSGTEHRKYLRQIFVSMDITAPLYWWKEMDQYKVGTVTDSCSTMHKIAAKQFVLEDFSVEHLYSDELEFFKEIVDRLNSAREMYLDNDIPSRKKCDWWQMIQLLPSSYNQRRTVTMNYENVVSIIRQRTGHKLDEWNAFVGALKDLPYVKEITDEGA